MTEYPLSRRAVVQMVASFWLSASHRMAFAQTEASAARWLDRVIDQRGRAPGEPLRFSRFRDPIYFLLEPISWIPDPEQAKRFSRVSAPAGFVTDLASIPRVFWSLLRPDGEYAYAAILHDYLYWTQERSREEADEVFLISMREFGVSEETCSLIYQGVKVFGGSSWSANTAARLNGEKRVLSRFPESPLTTWDEWRRDGKNFL